MLSKKKNTTDTLLLDAVNSQTRMFFWLVTAVLFCLGAYKSVLLFGHQIVPNPDFPTYYWTGEAIMSLRWPDTFKRGPVLGILQVLATNLVTGGYQSLKAGWLVNAIFYPFNIVLIWVVGRRIFGDSARWLAVVVAVNCWMLYLLTEPIAETTYLFFILLTILFIFKRSSFAYLLAAITTMVRYEAAALILAAFLVDMVYAENRKQRWTAFVFSVIASVPLLFWLTQIIINSTPTSTDYYNVFKTSIMDDSKAMGDRTGIGKHLKLIWYTGYSNLMSVPLKSHKASFASMANFSQFIATATFVLGLIYAAVRKNWEIMVLLIFLVPYFIIHAYYPYPIPRFHHTSFWIALIISCYGVIELWKTINKGERIPSFIISAAQVIFIISMFVWCVYLYKNLEYSSKICSKVLLIPYIAMLAGVLISVAYLCCNKFQGKLKECTVLMLIAVILISNQISVASLLSGGNRDAEFKMLADWYVTVAMKNEGLATTQAGIVQIYCKRGKIVHYRDNDVATIDEFIDSMLDKDVKYIAWDSRLGLAPRDPYYKQKVLDIISPLAKPADIGRLKFVKQFINGKNYINVFEIKKTNAFSDKQQGSHD